MKKKQHLASMENDNSSDDDLDKFYSEMWASCPHVSFEELDHIEDEKEEKYLGDYILEDHNDVCFADEVGYIPYIESSKENIIQLMEFEKLKHDLTIDIHEYTISSLSNDEKRQHYSNARTKIIRQLYDYKGTKSKVGIIPNTEETIRSWYILGFDTVEKIEDVFILEDVYDMNIDLKVFVEDQPENQSVNGRKHIKILQYFKAFIDQNGVQYLSSSEYCIGIIISVLIDLDISQKGKLNDDYIVYKVKENIYSTIAMALYKKHYEAMVPFLVRRYKKAKTDIELDLSRIERKAALQETAEIVQSLLQIDVKDYESLQIFFDRINKNPQGLTGLLRDMEKAEINYMMSIDNKTWFYPYIVDMLLDIYRYEYMANHDKKYVDDLKPALVVSKELAYKEKIFSDQHLYHKTLLLDSIKRNQIRRYLLNQYHKVIQSDFKELSRFYTQLIYRPNQEVPDAYKMQMNIDKIPLSTSFRYYSIFIK